MTRMNALALSLFLSFSVINAGKLGEGQVLAPSRLGELVLSHDNNGFGFSVEQNGTSRRVQRCFMSPELRGISQEKLGKFLEDGYISVSQMSDGEYSLSSHVRGNGGGPAFGAFMYWTTKVICYSSLVAGVFTGVVEPEFGGHAARAARATQQANPAIAAGAAYAVEHIAEGAACPFIGVIPAVTTYIATDEIGRPLSQAVVATAATGGAAALTGAAGTIEVLATTVGVIFGMAPTP